MIGAAGSQRGIEERLAAAFEHSRYLDRHDARRAKLCLDVRARRVLRRMLLFLTRAAGRGCASAAEEGGDDAALDDLARKLCEAAADAAEGPLDVREWLERSASRGGPPAI